MSAPLRLERLTATDAVVGFFTLSPVSLRVDANLAQRLARAQRANVGGVFLAVDPKTPALCDWYERFGFTVIDPQRTRLRMIMALL